MGIENNSTCCKDDVVSSTVAFIVGGILIFPQILVSLVVIAAVGPRCIRKIATQLQYEKKEYSNLHIMYYVAVCFGPALLILVCFQVNFNNFDKAFYTVVGLCIGGAFLTLFGWLCCGLYVKRSFERGDFSESLATRLVGDVDHLLIDRPGDGTRG